MSSARNVTSMPGLAQTSPPALRVACIVFRFRKLLAAPMAPAVSANAPMSQPVRFFILLCLFAKRIESRRDGRQTAEGAFRIDRGVAGPLGGQVTFGEHGLDGTLGHA